MSHRYARGFTLTELLISIAIALILILGIATVFRLTGETIGAGMALSASTRDQRAAQTVFATDFGGLANTNPGIAIWSGTTLGYLDPATRDQDPLRDSQPSANRTRFRTDRLGMFVTGEFHRQSGNDNYLTSDVTADQAYVWYGHLLLPDNGGAFFYNGNANQPILPGSINPNAGSTFSTNPNNYFARQWTLGRVALLMKTKDASGQILDKAGTPQYFIDDDNSTTNDMRPFMYNSPATNDPATAKPRVQESRYDLVGLNGTSTDTFARVASKLVGTWWNFLDYPFQADPYPQRPLTSAGAAKTAPLFLPGASDFITEFAGDYVTQVSTGTDMGDVSAPLPDGVIDFAVEKFDPSDDATWIKQVRYYGFPRDVNGDGLIDGDRDVIPFKWFVSAATFEKNEGTSTEFDDKPASFPGTPLAVTHPSAATNRQYVTAWTSADAPTIWPKLIRVTYTMQDAQGRLRNPQPVEMIFKVN
ncbi:MAG TPA: prepilin-type N-terminal cleavage/methylation domain-containing protein [Tepidisphaeraceae bacterium]|jgi:prepilin-type N-terminal cleavage/methylation domain-containing protein|nr:prepilin-type N-terminal cleavage/methylation domain-containing protein [Tepidisphaeraceae bacterium]